MVEADGAGVDSELVVDTELALEEEGGTSEEDGSEVEEVIEVGVAVTVTVTTEAEGEVDGRVTDKAITEDTVSPVPLRLEGMTYALASVRA